MNKIDLCLSSKKCIEWMLFDRDREKFAVVPRGVRFHFLGRSARFDLISLEPFQHVADSVFGERRGVLKTDKDTARF